MSDVQSWLESATQLKLTGATAEQMSCVRKRGEDDKIDQGRSWKDVPLYGLLDFFGDGSYSLVLLGLCGEMWQLAVVFAEL